MHEGGLLLCHESACRELLLRIENHGRDAKRRESVLFLVHCATWGNGPQQEREGSLFKSSVSGSAGSLPSRPGQTLETRASTPTLTFLTSTIFISGGKRNKEQLEVFLFSSQAGKYELYALLAAFQNRARAGVSPPIRSSHPRRPTPSHEPAGKANHGARLRVTQNGNPLWFHPESSVYGLLSSY